MNDPNPLGQIMHLRELERQVMPRLRPLRAKGKSTLIVTMITIVQRCCMAFRRETLGAAPR